ncbi:unnamed protein product [Brassica oleracea var. botrytis]
MTSICNGSISSIVIFGYYKFYTTVRSQYLPIVLSLNVSRGHVLCCQAVNGETRLGHNGVRRNTKP